MHIYNNDLELEHKLKLGERIIYKFDRYTLLLPYHILWLMTELLSESESKVYPGNLVHLLFNQDSQKLIWNQCCICSTLPYLDFFAMSYINQSYFNILYIIKPKYMLTSSSHNFNFKCCFLEISVQMVPIDEKNSTMY